MVNTNNSIMGRKVVGYVRVESKDDLFLTDQDARIERFVTNEDLDLTHIEHEVNAGKVLMRLGVWKLLHDLNCLDCPERQMPMSADYKYWLQEAFKPCSCQTPRPANGILVSDISILCTDPPQGAQFTLDMCMLKKHVYSITGKRCLSCCNPQAIEFMKRKNL